MASVLDTSGITTAEIRALDSHIKRHALVDRLFHWLTAASVLTLMGTAFLPILGVKFDWVVIHWSAGLVLIALVLFHIVRSLIWQRLRTMWFSEDEMQGTLVGKYSVAQKLMHIAMTLMILGVLITGAFMLAKMDTPWWKRDPYMLSQQVWGLIYVVHGLAALSAVTLVMVHVYFSLIPSNRMYLRAMIKGWITRDELLQHHGSAPRSRRK